MSKFDIKAHLQDHAYYFKQVKEISKSDLHFNFSYLDIQFFNSDKTPETTLFELLQELKKEASYRVRNGYYIDKNGEKKQKYTTRKINLKDVVKIEAIHTVGSEGEYVMPHIHLILDKNARLGKDFSLLKTHIIEVSKRFGLRPNFAEISQNNPASYKNLAKAVKNFSWIIRKMPNKDFKKYVENKLKDKLDKLWEYTLLSGNLQYYIKTLEFIKKRLNRQKLDFNYKGHNLRNTYPLPLTQQDLQVIELINKKKFSQKDIKPYLQNAILRDFVRYSYFKDKSKAFIIDSISKQTELFKNLRPNKKAIENYLKLCKKTLNQDKQTQIKEQQEQKKELSIKEILKDDLIKVAKSCKNEKELREKMQELNYIDFGFKKKSGKVYAYQFKLKNSDKKIIVKCSDSVSIKEIRAILKENFIKSKKNEAIRSDMSDERSKINTYTLPTPPIPVKIEYKRSKNEELQKFIGKTDRIEREIERTEQHINETEQKISRTDRIIRNRTEDNRETEQQIKRVKQQAIQAEQQINATEQTITSRIRSVRDRISSSIKSVKETASRIGRRLISTLRRRNNRKNSNNRMSR